MRTWPDWSPDTSTGACGPTPWSAQRNMDRPLPPAPFGRRPPRRGCCCCGTGGDHTRLTFYLGDLTVPLGAELPPPTVTEVAFRPRDTGLRETVSYLTAQGFVPVLERLRLSRPAERRESRLSPFLPRRRRRSPLCRPFCSPISPPDRLPSQPGRTGPGPAPGPCTHLGGRGARSQVCSTFPW